jgi:hypothetical protein
MEQIPMRICQNLFAQVVVHTPITLPTLLLEPYFLRAHLLHLQMEVTCQVTPQHGKKSI